jgi:hypothetical protein
MNFDAEEYESALAVANHLAAVSTSEDLEIAFDVLCRVRDQAQEALTAINAERSDRLKADTDALKAKIAARA